jgi:hypothetical protein
MYVCSGGEEKREKKNEMGEGGCICVMGECILENAFLLKCIIYNVFC